MVMLGIAHFLAAMTRVPGQATVCEGKGRCDHVLR